MSSKSKFIFFTKSYYWIVGSLWVLNCPLFSSKSLAMLEGEPEEAPRLIRSLRESLWIEAEENLRRKMMKDPQKNEYLFSRWKTIPAFAQFKVTYSDGVYIRWVRERITEGETGLVKYVWTQVEAFP